MRKSRTRYSLTQHGGYFKAPDFIFELPLSRNAKLILLYLCRRADRDGLSFPSLQRIGKDCSIKSKTTVEKAVKELVKAGLVFKIPLKGKSNTYRLSEQILSIVRPSGREDQEKNPEQEYKPSELNSPLGQNLNSKEYPLKENSFKEDNKFNSSLNDNSLLEEKSIREKEDLHPNGTCHKEIIDTIVGGLVHPDASHFSTPPPSSNGTSGRLPLEQAREILNTSELYRKLKQIKVFADLTPEQKAEADKQLEEIARKNQERFNGKLSQ